MGVQVRMAPTTGNSLGECLDGAKLLWLESPSYPGLDVCDIAELTTLAHTAGALVAVYNTTPTILGQNPLALGADFSVASDTKPLTGNSDLILGHVAARDAEWAERIHTRRIQHGSIAGRMEVCLTHRSLATLSVRLEHQYLNAQAIAEQQMKLFGPVVSFVLADQSQAERFLQSCKLVYGATSFGGIHTTAERLARWGGDKISDGFIRSSAGCENTEDLLNDLGQALDASHPATAEE
jgi:cystathionine gamma-lyase